jgi:hypothetical protein
MHGRSSSCVRALAAISFSAGAPLARGSTVLGLAAALLLMGACSREAPPFLEVLHPADESTGLPSAELAGQARVVERRSLRAGGEGWSVRHGSARDVAAVGDDAQRHGLLGLRIEPYRIEPGRTPIRRS